jgi:carbonic anhydrase
MILKMLRTIAMLFLTVWLNRIDHTEARSWKDIALIHEMNPPDNVGVIFLESLALQLLNDSLFGFTYSPVAPSNRLPSTIAPSPAPSNGPTNHPSEEPSDSPSEHPTHQPSDRPSEFPSATPTLDPYPRVGGPREGEQGYFNYDQSPNSLYGPSKWGSVGLPELYYWDEFGSNGYGPWKGVLSERNLYENVCEKGLKHQSPIDVHETFGECIEKHEVRDSTGDFPLYDDRVDKRIEPNKLRIIFPRRPCANINITECQFPHPPWADFPNGWKFIADVIHIDFKIPSEHLLEGERFDGEMQIYHLHPINKRVVTYASLVRALPKAHNSYLQIVLDAFQREYDKNHAACAQARNVGSDGNISSILPSSAPSPSSINASHDSGQRGLHGIPDAFNPYDPNLITSFYFYRYDGSITEPPCAEFVTWFISDRPMFMSLEQLEQWRRLQFTNVDVNCQSTSVHSGRSVARPISPPAADRQVTRCTRENFLPDPQRRRRSL